MRERFGQENPRPNSATNSFDTVERISGPYSARSNFKVIVRDVSVSNKELKVWHSLPVAPFGGPTKSIHADPPIVFAVIR